METLVRILFYLPTLFLTQVLTKKQPTRASQMVVCIVDETRIEEADYYVKRKEKQKQKT